MSKHKNIIKYIVCFTLTAAVTCSILFFPSLYFKYKDSRSMNNAKTESFSIASDDVNMLDVMRLIADDNAFTSAVETPYKAGELQSYAMSAVEKMSQYLSSSVYQCKAVETLTEDKNSSITYSECYNISGIVDGKPVSARLLSVIFSGESFEYASMIIDLERDMIYLYEIYYAYDYELDNIGNSEFEYENDLLIKDLSEYWALENVTDYVEVELIISNAEYGFILRNPKESNSSIENDENS